jgi:hypothetical protein
VNSLLLGIPALLAFWPFGRERKASAPEAPAPAAPPGATIELQATAFDSVKAVQRYRDPDQGHAAFAELQVWFVNPSEDLPMPARQVRARLTFKQDGEPVFGAVAGQWLVSPPDDVHAQVTMTDAIDLNPDGTPARLLLAYKWPREPIAYPYTADNATAPGARDDARALPPGEYDLIITLWNEEFEDDFTFRLANGGGPVLPALTGPLRVHRSRR